MINQLQKSIQLSFEKSIKLIVEICESEIEKIFLLKIIDYVINRPDRYSIGFILKGSDTNMINGLEVVTSPANYQMPDDFGYLCGLRIIYLQDNKTIEIFPQLKVKFENPSNFSQPINYRIDFAIYKLEGDSNTITRKYCVECDGFDFHNTKDQIKKDNERMRNLMLLNEISTIRYLGTEIYNWKDDNIGLFLFNL
jgi:hypothetical protein